MQSNEQEIAQDYESKRALVYHLEGRSGRYVASGKRLALPANTILIAAITSPNQDTSSYPKVSFYEAGSETDTDSSPFAVITPMTETFELDFHNVLIRRGIAIVVEAGGSGTGGGCFVMYEALRKEDECNA